MILMQDHSMNEETVRRRSRRRVTAGAGAAGERREKAWKKPDRRSSAASVRIRRILVLAVLEVFVLAGIFVYAYGLRQFGKLQRQEFEAKNVENKELSHEDIQKMKGYWNIAAFGVDSRDSSLGRGNNSDVIMIVSINRENGDVRISSVFRDTYLSLADGSYSKINSAYAIGGPEQAVKALNQNLDLNITDYVTFNWKAVATGVNILGGVDIELTNAEFKYINSYITETVKGTGIGSVQLKHAGMNHLDGIQAVAYARLRYMDDDYTRTERQRKIIALCVEKAKHADVQTLSDLAGNMLSMVATSLRWEDGMNLALNVTKYKIAGTLGFPMDRKEANMGKRGACVLPNTLESNVKQLHTFLFADQDYTVSNQVREIDDKIASDAVNYKNRAAESRYRQMEEEEERAREESAEERARKSAAETDEEGRTLIETDAHGRPVRETDEDGNPLYDYDESDAPDLWETDSNGRLIEGGGVRPGQMPDGHTESGSAGRPGTVLPGDSASESASLSTTAAAPTSTTAEPTTSAPHPEGGAESGYVQAGPGHTTAAGTEATPAPTTAADNSGRGGPGSAATVDSVPQ